jgi:hypothetical protein
MSDPWPPAFMATAPPTEPGTPTAHSNPVSPASTLRRATTGRPAAAPARRRPSGAMSIPASPGPRWTATPGNPASATRRLDPLPTTSSGTGRPPMAPRRATRSASSSAST